MTTMKRLLPILLLLFTLTANSCSNDNADFQDGMDAYDRKDYKTALEKFKPLVEQGDAKAQHEMGVLHTLGKGVPRDHKEAIKWYRLAADQGNAKGQHKLGVMYTIGLGVPQDQLEAIKWFMLAADQGNTKAQISLGAMYKSKDYVRAYKWYSIAEANGDDSAVKDKDIIEKEMTLAQIAEAQKLVKEWVSYRGGVAAYKRRDYKIAFEKLKPLAEKGDAFVQGMLGTMYVDGKGVTQDYKEAVKWYRKSAEQGTAAGQFSLGSMYEKGRGVTKDLSEAVKWYRKSAEQGKALAQKKISFMYATGTGISKDLIKSYMWVELASQQLDMAEARKFLEKRITPAQITEAQKLAKEWMEKHK